MNGFLFSKLSSWKFNVRGIVCVFVSITLCNLYSYIFYMLVVLRCIKLCSANFFIQHEKKITIHIGVMLLSKNTAITMFNFVEILLSFVSWLVSKHSTSSG